MITDVPPMFLNSLDTLGGGPSFTAECRVYDDSRQVNTSDLRTSDDDNLESRSEHVEYIPQADLFSDLFFS